MVLHEEVSGGSKQECESLERKFYGKNGNNERIVGFFEGEKEMVASADCRSTHIFGTISVIYGIFSGSSVYIYAVLIVH